MKEKKKYYIQTEEVEFNVGNLTIMLWCWGGGCIGTLLLMLRVFPEPKIYDIYSGIGIAFATGIIMFVVGVLVFWVIGRFAKKYVEI